MLNALRQTHLHVPCTKLLKPVEPCPASHPRSRRPTLINTYTRPRLSIYYISLGDVNKQLAASVLLKLFISGNERCHNNIEVFECVQEHAVRHVLSLFTCVHSSTFSTEFACWLRLYNLNDDICQ